MRIRLRQGYGGQARTIREGVDCETGNEIDDEDEDDDNYERDWGLRRR
ncbi:MAG: hypothetical protein JWR19_236 [Pedosphaera sp.]|nr:hypothetical protein [Pedosphaera sp.]